MAALKHGPEAAALSPALQALGQGVVRPLRDGVAVVQVVLPPREFCGLLMFCLRYLCGSFAESCGKISKSWLVKLPAPAPRPSAACARWGPACTRA